MTGSASMATWRRIRWMQWCGAASVGFALVGFVAAGCTSSRRGGRSLPGEILLLGIKGRSIEAELANDNISRHTGLMYRKSMPENHGMLFVWPHSQMQAFWMKNTLLPLSIAFIDEKGTILQIEDMQPQDESMTRSKTMARYALEVHQGWFRKNGIQSGDSIDDFAEKVRESHDT